MALPGHDLIVNSLLKGNAVFAIILASNFIPIIIIPIDTSSSGLIPPAIARHETRTTAVKHHDLTLDCLSRVTMIDPDAMTAEVYRVGDHPIKQPLSTLSFAEVENSMQKARRRTQPAVPATIVDLVALVQVDERYNTTCAGERMLLEVQELGIDGTNLLFLSPSLRMAATLATEVHLDGTFKVVPRMFQQLLTVHFIAMNHVSDLQ
ncbi:uncharacterized protein LOC125179287 [Hyalella azteca]|uniref:Uncharacterized protein LOC125179287 n=1 Tax=Hyalella azteca TaxID=294128 RepID=A0A979FUE0_HYAAZ|nr:uncharacterized protein LOC125179287 [Hyalella azteca]